ncbi:nuclear transport factor 2 family protein [Demetria terragena]|uniref:nuclear transport factor 2 family protein n=1 Tax=Demetria terragena TaxID=63959 RepID=UPI0003666A70|nr:nuclear transport factor 2 family protein [Demetria terragena]
MADLTIPEPVLSFIETVNRHDEQGFLDAFTDRGAVDDWGRVFSGREAIKGWSDGEFIGATGTLTPEEVTDNGVEVTVIGDWRSTHANGRSAFTFRIDEGKIARMTIREG